jgi:SAM-dependent methyltransferase
MLGVGHKEPARQLFAPDSATEAQTKWMTLDENARAKPDILFDLNNLHLAPPVPVTSVGHPKNRIPVADEEFDEIHAYEVLEHIGRQGDFKAFFLEFAEYWRILKPGGWLIGTCPDKKGEWVWDDPGHTRTISGKTLSFLTMARYNEIGETAVSDYREYVNPNWWRLNHSETKEHKDKDENIVSYSYFFGLQKV